MAVAFGKQILLLERGGYLPREKDNWSSKTVFLDNKYKAKETWKDKDGGTFHPGIHYNVGGNSKVYGAALTAHARAGLQRGEASWQHFSRMADLLRRPRILLYPSRAPVPRARHTRGGRSNGVEGQRALQISALTHEPRIQELHDDWQRCGYKPFQRLPGLTTIVSSSHSSTSRPAVSNVVTQLLVYLLGKGLDSGT